ncbi:MAG: hypothetical protein AAF663_00055 [Planctomycetota bacterium]
MANLLVDSREARGQLVSLQRGFETLSRVGGQEARFAVIDTTRRTQAEVNRRIRRLINIKRTSLTRRSRIVIPRAGEALQSELVYLEKAPPLIGSFTGVRVKARPGRRRRLVQGNQLTGARSATRGLTGVVATVRLARGAETFPAAFARRARLGATAVDSADSQQTRLIYFQRARDNQRASGRSGRRPYFAIRGRSPLGVLLERPGFLNEVEVFAADTLQREAARRYDRYINRLVGR